MSRIDYQFSYLTPFFLGRSVASIRKGEINEIYKWFTATPQNRSLKGKAKECDTQSFWKCFVWAYRKLYKMKLQSKAHKHTSTGGFEEPEVVEETYWNVKYKLTKLIISNRCVLPGLAEIESIWKASEELFTICRRC